LSRLLERGARFLPSRWAFIQIAASSLAPAHSSVLLALEFGFLPICPLDGIVSDPTSEAFFHESEWARREIHIDGVAI
jgi:hypothetical protein